MTGRDAFRHGGFAFEAASAAIGSERELDSLRSAIGAERVPLPEECYPRNGLNIRHEDSGWTLSLDTVGMLRAWNRAQHECGRYVGQDGDACDATSFDWTYNGFCYDGDVKSSAGDVATAKDTASSTSGMSTVQTDDGHSTNSQPSSLSLPLDKLRRRDVPILFFASVPLFTDELHDRGRTEAVVKLRVMEDCFLVLLRLYTRIDGVSVFLRDVRWYGGIPPQMHRGGGDESQLRPVLLKDVQVRTATMADLRAAMGLPPLDFTTPMLVADRLAAAARQRGEQPPWVRGANASASEAVTSSAAGAAPCSEADGRRSAVASTAAVSALGGGSPLSAPRAFPSVAPDQLPATLLRLDVSADEVYAALQPSSMSTHEVLLL